MTKYALWRDNCGICIEKILISCNVSSLKWHHIVSQITGNAIIGETAGQALAFQAKRCYISLNWCEILFNDILCHSEMSSP